METYDMDGNDGVGMEQEEKWVYEAEEEQTLVPKPWMGVAGGLLKHVLRSTGSSESQGNTDILQVGKSFSALLAHSGAR